MTLAGEWSRPSVRPVTFRIFNIAMYTSARLSYALNQFVAYVT
jgi:hypothetical protein